MDKKLIGVLTGASALALLAGGASASTTSTPSGVRAAASFAELLDPVPDAVSVLKADDQRARETAAGGIQLAQYDDEGFRGHHHHHHHFRRFEDGPRGYGFGFRRFERGYHHHHHHHYRRYYGD